MVNKGRQASGMQNGMSKLTHNNIVSMRSDYQANERNIKELSEKFVYLNDDMIIWKQLDIDRFFKENVYEAYYYW